MDARIAALIDELTETHRLTSEGYAELIDGRDDEAARLLAERARAAREPYYGHRVFIRGLVEFSNVCQNDCLYCGIRRSNRNVERYRFDPDTIVACARAGWEMGYRTIVLQSGEVADGHADEVLAGVVSRIVATCPDTAVTFSVGERERESYRRLFDAGTTRYLLRHETAAKAHYERLHPPAPACDELRAPYAVPL